MLHVVAKNYVKNENHAEFLKIARELIELTRKEDGCIRYSLTKSDKDPDILVYIEQWKSKDAFDFHINSEHFNRINPILKKLKLKDSDVSFFEDAVIL